MDVIVVGAGILGSALALRLARAGAQVTVIDAAPAPAMGATGASFGWINAGFYLDTDHFRLRLEGLAAWHRLARCVDLGDALNWCGALNWELQGAELEDQQERLAALGYESSMLNRDEIGAREPALANPPENALLFAQEAVAEPAGICARLLGAAQAAGARVLFGVHAHSATRDTVTTDQGRFDAGAVVLCAGTATPHLAGLGQSLPMLPRPALVLRSAPCDLRLRHVLVTPQGEVRQDHAGRLVMPTSPAHQGCARTEVAARPDRVADAAARRLRELFGDRADISWTDVTVAQRPVPGDDRPVVGRQSDDRPYLAVMHSGVTLAAVVAELASAEILGAPSNRTALLSPYRPGRFTGSSRGSTHGRI